MKDNFSCLNRERVAEPERTGLVCEFWEAALCTQQPHSERLCAPLGSLEKVLESSEKHADISVSGLDERI